MIGSGGKKKQKAEGLRGKKKQKVTREIILLQSPVLPALFTSESIARLREEHDSNQPYKHVVFDSLCDPDRMRLVGEEAKNNMTTSFKETDLFKVCHHPWYQVDSSIYTSIADQLITRKQHLSLSAYYFSAQVEVCLERYRAEFSLHLPL